MLPRSEPAARVVVCEDDVPTLDLLCDHLDADRFEALAAPSAGDALRLYHYNDPDLLLLDLRLPDASAWTCCGRSARPSDRPGDSTRRCR
jgi:DNA-binding response OmpR family regulator